jgi:uroporphyrinogen decarboxylase
MEEINRRCPFNILHICDYHSDEYGGYDDLTPFLDYPGHVVNCNPVIGGRTLSGAELSGMFGRPFMGGMERRGILATGTEEEVRREARRILREAPGRFILGADCTVPAGTPWENLRAAIDEAHRFPGEGAVNG